MDHSLNQGAPAGHKSAETPIGHESSYSFNTTWKCPRDANSCRAKVYNCNWRTLKCERGTLTCERKIKVDRSSKEDTRRSEKRVWRKNDGNAKKMQSQMQAQIQEQMMQQFQQRQ